ncbi:MAG: hypothetical protein AAF614_27885 [Chloroflexota bacterium]
MSYEFNEKQNDIIKGVGIRFRIIGVLLMLLGVSALITGLIGLVGGESALADWALVFLSAVQIVSGVLFYRPTDNFLRIASTSGNDIPELITAFRELANGLKLIVVLAVLGTILVFVSNMP